MVLVSLGFSLGVAEITPCDHVEWLLSNTAELRVTIIPRSLGETSKTIKLAKSVHRRDLHNHT